MMIKVTVARILNAAKHSQWGNEMKGKRNCKYFTFQFVLQSLNVTSLCTQAEKHSSEGRAPNVKAQMFWLTLLRT